MRTRLGLGQRVRVKARPHGRQAAWQVGQRRSHGIPDMATGKERGPDDIASATHVGGVHVQQFDRGKGDPGAAEHVGLQRYVVDVVILQATAALDLAQPPSPGRKALQYIHPDTNAVVFERGLEDGGDARVRHQGGRAGNGLGVLPGFFGDFDAAGSSFINRRLSSRRRTAH